MNHRFDRLLYVDVLLRRRVDVAVHLVPRLELNALLLAELPVSAEVRLVADQDADNPIVTTLLVQYLVHVCDFCLGLLWISRHIYHVDCAECFAEHFCRERSFLGRLPPDPQVDYRVVFVRMRHCLLQVVVVPELVVPREAFVLLVVVSEALEEGLLAGLGIAEEEDIDRLIVGSTVFADLREGLPRVIHASGPSRTRHYLSLSSCSERARTILSCKWAGLVRVSRERADLAELEGSLVPWRDIEHEWILVDFRVLGDDADLIAPLPSNVFV